MGVKDLVLMGLIIGGALYLLYRSFSPKKGPCCGCGSAKCPESDKSDSSRC
jgi:hypothetical protein